MPLQLEDISELAYGGLVTGTKELDKRRVSDARISDKEIWKKYSTYAYLVPGVISTGAAAFGWLPRYSSWTERLAHGFIYGFPGFVMEVVNSYSNSSVSRNTVNDAQAYLRAQKKVAQTPGAGFEGLRTY